MSGMHESKKETERIRYMNDNIFKITTERKAMIENEKGTDPIRLTAQG